MVLKSPSKKISDRQTKAAGRRAIIIVFGLTLFLIALVYLKTGWQGTWRSLTSPLVITNAPQEKQFDPQPILNEIENLTKDLRGTYGVYVFQLQTGREYGLHHQEVFPAASLVKLPVMLTLYRQAEAGQLNLADQYTLKEVDKMVGAGVLQSKIAGEVYTYRQLAEFMGQYSDNTAYNAVLKKLSLEQVQQTVEQLGMSATDIKEFETSPADMGLFWQKFYQGDLVNDLHQQEMLAFLTDTAFEDRIPAGVPDEVRVAHKVGTEIGNFADTGIVFGPESFVLVIITRNAREAEALEAIPQITRKVWEFETAN